MAKSTKTSVAAATKENVIKDATQAEVLGRTLAEKAAAVPPELHGAVIKAFRERTQEMLHKRDVEIAAQQINQRSSLEGLYGELKPIKA